jgi:putative spermidine/putrescine transport system substrate-binding protein
MLSSHRSLTRLGGLAAIAALTFAACSSAGTSSAPSSAASVAAPPSAAASAAASSAASGAPSAAASAADMTALIAKAKAEGALTTIALPRDWCNYGAAIDGFTKKYGITIKGLNPGGGSKDELAAITANKNNPGPAAPDVVDVGLAFGPQGVDQGLFQPYKVATWDSIPDSAKSADGMWYGDYFGVMSFEVNTKVITTVPKDWPDLLKPDYKKAVALFGDPLASNQAQSAVWAAGLSSNGGNLDSVKEGLDFFKQLNAAGNFVPVIASTATVASGNTPIRLGWTYNGLADKDKLKGNPPIEVVVPTSGRFGGMYVQAISAFAPHPNAAKLWMEYLYSDEGQNIWLSGYCNPIRYDDMAAKNTLDPTALAKLPDSKGTKLPTLAQITAASKAITAGWPITVGVTVK